VSLEKDHRASLRDSSIPPLAEAPSSGEPFDQIAADFQSLVLPGLSLLLSYPINDSHRIGITHWQHGQFFAYFPAITTFESILGDLYSSSVNNPGFNVSSNMDSSAPGD